MFFINKGQSLLLMSVLILIIISSISIASAAQDNLTQLTDIDDNVVYVSNDGIDTGNGSQQAPYSSLKHAVANSQNNTKIILKEGIYKGLSNTKITIDKNLEIEADGSVTIDGENKNFFFRISKSSSLILKNIKFINGYTSDYSQLAVINNNGYLSIENSTFTNMNTIMGAIFNQGKLTVKNTSISKSTSQNYAQAIVNLKDCTITNSTMTSIYSSQDEIPVVYNYNNMNISDSKIDMVDSNSNYDDSAYSSSNIFIKNTQFNYLNIDDAYVTLIDSKINTRASFRNSEVNISDSVFLQNSVALGLSIFYCNFTAIHTIFDTEISAGYTDFNITYSAILKNFYGGGKYGYLYAPYNWWGINSGPSLSYFKNYNVTYWAVATFEYENDTIPINPQGKFTVALNKWSDGKNLYNFDQSQYLPMRNVRFESQNGRFLYSNMVLEGEVYNYLISNTLDAKVYAIVDRQRMVLNVGNSISQYTYFVSPEGHDGTEDGSFEKPFLTLQYAVSRAGNGNTICILGGINKNPANSNVCINKNITIIGLGDATIVRSNANSVFNIEEWGSLTIKNIRFEVTDREYTDAIIFLDGGNLHIVNSTFTSITSSGVISTSRGIESSGNVMIEDSKFYDIKGSAVSGVAKSVIINTTFEGFTNYYDIVGLESYNCIFPVTNTIEIYDSRFTQNSIGIINLHPYYYSRGLSSESPSTSGIYAYVENSVFENNIFRSENSYYTSSGTGFLIHDNYGSFTGYINNCSFIANNGPIALATNVNGSTFIRNTASAYGSEALVRADSVYNSQFIENSNLYRDGDGAFIGEGIASAGVILNSTFMYNKAAFGGAVANAKEVHYSVFVNNTSVYGGNDIFSSPDDADYSTNWWGDNQKPGDDKVFKFLGTLTISDWIIMSLEYTSNKQIRASLINSIDDKGNIQKVSGSLPSRPVSFSIDNGEISPEHTYLINGIAYAVLNSNFNSDFKAYAVIDNQMMEVNVRNTHTRIIMEDSYLKGKDNKYYLELINVNGFKISNQTLLVEITDENSQSHMFTIVSDDEGKAQFNVDYPVGVYRVDVRYLGNGYFTKSNASAKIEVVISPTAIIAYNHTYYGKMNSFSAILSGENNIKLYNFTINFTVSDKNGNKMTYSAQTDYYGIGEVLLSLEIGEYDVKSEFKGNSWYDSCEIMSHIIVCPVNTTLYVPDITFYGRDNMYNITLKDIYGNLVREENVHITITQEDVSDKFTLKTDDFGVAGLTINYLPGTYNVHAEYSGDEVYGASSADAIIKIERVLTIISGFHYTTIPVGGVYTAVLSDMHGKRVSDEKITLNVYQGSLLKQYNLSTDANGEATFTLNLGEGKYLATMDFNGSIWYEDSTNAATIIISNDVAPQDVSIEADDLVQYYGEDKFFTIRFNDPNAYSQYGKTITVTLSSGTWSSSYNLNTDTYGMARLKITLNPGEYEVTYKYTNAYYHLFASNSSKITVYKTPSKILVMDLIANKDQTRILDVELRDINNSPIKNMQISVDINGKLQNITTNKDGIAKLPVSLDVGKYEIRYNFTNPNYLPSTAKSMVLVVDSDKTPSILKTSDASVLDNQTLNFTVRLTDSLNSSIALSKVSIEILTFEDESVLNRTAFTDSNGKVIFDLKLDYGRYIVRTIYDGNELYLGSSATNTIIVDSSDNKTPTRIFSSETALINSGDYYIVLSDLNGALLKDKQIKFSIASNVSSVMTDNEGKAYLNLNLTPDVYILKAVFEGDENYRPTSLQTKLYISSNSTRIYAPELVKYYRNGTQFHVRLVDVLLNPISNEKIIILLENKKYNCTTDENGWTSLDIDLLPGDYDVECYYYGKSVDENSFNTTRIRVLATISGRDEIKYFGDLPYLTIGFVDGAGNKINNTPFIIGIDGKNYYAQTDDRGLFNFDLNLNPGNHTISVIHPYDGLYGEYKLEILQTVFANDLVKIVNDNSKYSALFLDNNGSPLANTNVDIIINSLRFVFKTDNKGYVKLDMNFKPDSYLVTAINPMTGEYIENKVVVLSSITENKNVVMYADEVVTFKVKIPYPNQKVTFNIDGKTFSVKSDKNGWASINLNKGNLILKTKKYIITTIFNGFSVYNTIKVKHVIIAKKLTKIKALKTAKIKIKLKGRKIIKNKRIIVKFNGKKYKIITNKKGIAFFKINKKMIMKLKKGKKYKLTITFKNDVVCRYVKVK